MTRRWLGRRARAVLGLGALACAALAAPGCVTNQATGRNQLDYLSREDEIALGTEAKPQLTQEYGGAVSDPRINQYVTSVGTSMVGHTEGDYRTLPWEFTLLNSDVINAFALPGGKVFISRALAERFTSEAQLAGVLGHEIGHVTAEHADRAVARQMGLGILAGVGTVLAGNDQTMGAAVGVLVSSAGVYSLSFSREQENEADALGMRYMTAAGYNPVGMLEVMKVLAAASQEGGGGGPPEFLSTHPDPRSRVSIITKRLEAAYGSAAGDTALATHEARFRTEFLDRIKSVPLPAAPAKPAAPARGRLDLSDPGSWCALCRERGEGHASASLRHDISGSPSAGW